MISFTYTIQDPEGLHARPVGRMICLIKAAESSVTLFAANRIGGELEADGRKIFAVMGLGLRCGETLRVEVEGSDEEKTANSIQEFLRQNL